MRSKRCLTLVIVLIRLAGANMMLIGLWGTLAVLIVNERRVGNFFVSLVGFVVGAVLLFFPRSRLPDASSIRRIHDWLSRRRL